MIECWSIVLLAVTWCFWRKARSEALEDDVRESGVSTRARPPWLFLVVPILIRCTHLPLLTWFWGVVSVLRVWATPLFTLLNSASRVNAEHTTEQNRWVEVRFLELYAK